MTLDFNFFTNFLLIYLFLFTGVFLKYFVKINEKMIGKFLIYLLAPIVRDRKGEYKKEFKELRQQGFQRVKVNGEFYELEAPPILDKKYRHNIDVVVDRIVIKAGMESRAQG